MTPTLGAVVDQLDEWYPPATADSWDAVGLVFGDPVAPVSRVMFAVDPTIDVAREAVEWGADLLVVHHPLFLKAVHGFAATTPKGRTLATLATGGCALLTAHTNADQAEGGVSEALAQALGLTDLTPIRSAMAAPLDKIVVHVPHEHAPAVRAALAQAGAGAIGDYDSCSYTTSGEGRFRPLPGANPTIGAVGDAEVVDEARIETILPRSQRAAVVAAMLAVHPYEEPAYDLVELADARREPNGTGRIGTVADNHAGRLRRSGLRSAAGDRPRGAGRRRSGPRRTTGGGVWRCGRLPARRARRVRGRRLRHLGPTPPSSGRVPGEARSRVGRHLALGGGVDVAARGAGAAGPRTGGYGGNPREHAAHGPVDNSYLTGRI